MRRLEEESLDGLYERGTRKRKPLLGLPLLSISDSTTLMILD
jgi:hypothetical protein